MVVYGVALPAGCYLVGVILGDWLGELVGVDANVGGVGIAMLLLLALTSSQRFKIDLGDVGNSGISFWSAMYIPIVIAMAAKQNVIEALSGGWMALLAGIAAVLASFALIPVLARFTKTPVAEATDD